MSPEPAAPLTTIASALRRERERVGISLTELARRAGVAKSTLSHLESGTGNPGVETLWALSEALGVPLSRLVEPAADGVRVIRAGDGPQVRSEQADFTGTLLSAGAAHLRRDIYLIRLEPGAVRTADAHTPRSVEHVVVAAGRLRLGPASGLVDLDPGDYATFPGDAPHRYEALRPGTFAVLVMEHP
ncbi:helix-turn-helix domain-containing protein [Micromonospora sp. ALFpr18c]|uniref:helix-turn-helix domain-containing protein n=1 Tax=unclassified Micromonospora TaxID=2617518 RepID=UPI00124AED6A|nr:MULTISPECIES: XRE family transcriptional regulator [unclassified Micromonospora]KAB1933782.1 helix-turn-helix domain-containing protein [Micromonospora sp. ALFpr18c]MDG4756812.1 XRE family transcriptional regulator [Micromonospora sp. WMMD710]